MAKILLVDDIPEFVDAEKDLLRECCEGYEVSVAANPEYALELLEKQAFDLVILDLMMPKQNGFELLCEIKRKYRIPVMIYSAYLDNISAKVLAREGADLILSKPAQLDIFLGCVQNLLTPASEATVLAVQGYKIRDIRNQVLTTIIQKALRKFSGRMTEASDALGISAECLKNLISKLHLRVEIPPDHSVKKSA